MFNYRDQADGLRRIMAKTSARIISVIGANGQPASQWVRQLAASMLTPEHRLLLVHAHRQAAITHSLQGIAVQRQAIKRGIFKHPQGYDLTCLGENDLLTSPLSQDLKAQLNGIVEQLAYDYDTVMIEAQLDSQDYSLLLPVIAEHELIIQMDRSDDAIKSAYATIKHISQRHGQIPLGVVVTDANQDQGKQYFMRLNQVCKQFLGLSLDFIGAMPAQTGTVNANTSTQQATEVSKQLSSTLAFKTVAHRLEQQRISMPSMAVA